MISIEYLTNRLPVRLPILTGLLIALTLVSAPIIGCGSDRDPATDTAAATDVEEVDEPKAEALPSPWPGDDPNVAIGVGCEMSGDFASIELWKFGEDQEFTQFHSVDLQQLLDKELGDDLAGPEVVAGPCAKRLQWSSDYRKALFSFVPDEGSNERRVALLDLSTGEVKDLTGPRQESEEFGSEILDEEDAIFEVVGEPGAFRIDDDSVIITVPNEEAWAADDTEFWYRRVSVDDPTRVTEADESDSRQNWFEPIEFDGDWNPGLTQYSLGGTWIAESSGSVEDLTAEGIEIAPSGAELKRKLAVCTGESAGVGWLDDSRYVIWDGTKLAVLTVDSSGSTKCGKNLLPNNKYSIADVKLSPDGSFVYLGWVQGAAEKSYRVPTAGGKPEAAMVPEPPEDLVMFQRALQAN